MHALAIAAALAVATPPAPDTPPAAAPAAATPADAPSTPAAPPQPQQPQQAAPAPAVQLPDDVLTVAVLDLRAGKGTEGIARALTTLVTTEIGARPGWRAVSRNELKTLLAHQADQRLLGCDEAACTADIGKLAQAKRVVFGSVEMAEGGAAVFSLTLVDTTDTPVILQRVAYTWKSAVDDMVDLARSAVDRLVLGKKAAALAGSVEILSPAGASVVIDDKELGQAPVKPVHDLAIGPHRIEVRKPGYVPFGKDVAVNADETQVVQVDLVDEASLQPWYARWYVWGSALAGVVVVGGTVAAVGTYEYLSTPAKIIVGGAP